MTAKISDKVWVGVLNEMVLRPKLAPAARKLGITPMSLHTKIKQSTIDPEKHRLVWLGHDQPFHMHIIAARKLSIIGLDAAARDLALNGHREGRFFNGEPVWCVDPKVKADAMTLDELDWIWKYESRPRSDVFLRDEAGALI